MSSTRAVLLPQPKQNTDREDSSLIHTIYMNALMWWQRVGEASGKSFARFPHLFMCQDCGVPCFILELTGTQSSCSSHTHQSPLNANVIFFIVFSLKHRGGLFAFFYVSEWVKCLLVGSLDSRLSSSILAPNSPSPLLGECPSHQAVVSAPGRHPSYHLLKADQSN